MRFAAFVVVMVFCFSLVNLVHAGDDSKILPEVSAPVTDRSSQGLVEEPAWGLTIVALMLGGFLFLFMEIAIIPGFGAAGIIGILLLGCGLVLAFMKLSTTMAVLVTMAAIIGLVLLLGWFFFYFPNTSLGKKFVLQAESTVENGCIAVQDLKKYVGKEGVATTVLRPSGIALVDGERLDVISDCEFIEKGTPIKIVKESGGRLVVTAVERD
ncbi:MAG: hypothetical protein Kow0029_28580 [Candidatus Rifleibacteriota bacterium]